MVCVGMQDEERKGHQFVIFDCRVTPEEFIVLFEDSSDKTPPPADAADGRIAVQALSSPERPGKVVWSWNSPGGSYPVSSEVMRSAAQGPALQLGSGGRNRRIISIGLETGNTFAWD